MKLSSKIVLWILAVLSAIVFYCCIYGIYDYFLNPGAPGNEFALWGIIVAIPVIIISLAIYLAVIECLLKEKNSSI